MRWLNRGPQPAPAPTYTAEDRRKAYLPHIERLTREAMYGALTPDVWHRLNTEDAPSVHVYVTIVVTPKKEVIKL